MKWEIFSWVPFVLRQILCCPGISVAVRRKTIIGSRLALINFSKHRSQFKVFCVFHYVTCSVISLYSHLRGILRAKFPKNTEWYFEKNVPKSTETKLTMKETEKYKIKTKSPEWLRFAYAILNEHDIENFLFIVIYWSINIEIIYYFLAESILW